MKYAIIGSALSGNKGAAAMLESAVQQLSERDKEARFVLLSMYPDSDAEQNPYRNVRVVDASPLQLGVVINSAAVLHRLLPPARRAIERAVPSVRALVGADVLLDQGGITFVDGRGKYLIYNVASVLPAVVLRTAVVKCAQAMGPFQERLNRTAAQALLPRMSAIVARGAVTEDHLRDLQLGNVEPGADLAFTLQVGEQDAASAQAKVDTEFFAGGDVVGLSPSAVLRKSAEARGEDYVGEVAGLIDHITGQLDRPVFLVAHSARAHTDKTHNNDLPLCREVFARVQHPERVLFVDQELGSQELRYLIGQCDVFVTSRFHAMVSSLATGVPTLVLGWSHKYGEVLDMFGLGQWALKHEDATAEGVNARLADLIEQRAQIREQIAGALPEVQATALQQIETILRVAND